MSGIEWTEKTWNPVVGCSPVSPGCLNCYAATMAQRLEAMGVAEYQPRDNIPPHPPIRIAEVRGGRAVFTGEVRYLYGRLKEPLRWRKGRMVFVNSMSDLFHESVPFEFIDRVFAVMAMTPQHTYQILTKRPEWMAAYLASRTNIHGGWTDNISEAADRIVGFGKAVTIDESRPWPLPNVWIGTSIENQKCADERIPHLLRCSAAVRFLSCEPLLEEVNIFDFVGPLADHAIGGGARHWVIVGGESGPGARPCDVAWIRSIVAQCKAAGVPCFVKQLGSHPIVTRDEAHRIESAGGRVEWDDSGEYVSARLVLSNRKGGDPPEWPDDLRVREWPQT